MKKTISPVVLNKVIHAPPSKSVMQRAVAIALLAEGKTIIKNPSFSKDSIGSIRIAGALGASVQFTTDQITIERTDDVSETYVNAGESGLGIRMFSSIVSLFGKKFTLDGEESLLLRPVEGIENALNQLGVSCVSNNGYLPVTISGKLKGGHIEIDGSISSQVLTGLLIALPKAEENSIVKVNNLKSIPYIDLSLKMIKEFGVEIENKDYQEFIIKGNQKYRSREYTVEGDWSGASFLLVAGLISGKVEVQNLDLNSKQADKKIIDVIKLAGGKLTIKENSITTEQCDLTAFTFDATDCPDLFPPLVSLAAYCKGISKISGVHRLRYKESDRGLILKNEFSKIGITIEIEEDTMYIHGGTVTGGEIDSNNDHRIAMAASIAALSATKPITIDNAESINKSYPNFYFDLFRSSLLPGRISKRRKR